MKKGKYGFVGFSLFGFLIFSITIAVFSSFSILVYDRVNVATGGDRTLIGLAVAGTIIVGAIICCIADLIRRKKMIEKPQKMILEATEKIASGDFSVKIAPLHDYSKYDGFDLIAENINIMTAELSKNELLKSDFISNVSHEIKTPLAVIQNYTKALQSKNTTKAQKEEFLNGLVLQTNKLSNLISNILKLNKLENQKIIPEIEKFDLAELLRVCTLSFENLFEKKKLELECNIDEVSILSSVSLLEIVFNNLISNAIKFTEPGGKITISLKENKTHAVVKVQDTGCGISKEVGQHIFDKFYQGDTSHTGEGNGLGLALVKQVIDVIGGEISVESSVGKGTIFTVKLKKEK